MKKIVMVLIFGCLLHSAYGQDTLITNENKKLEVKVLQKTDNTIEYRMSDYLEGPLLIAKSSTIRKILYNNGTIDNMDYDNPRKNRPIGVSVGIAYRLNEENGMFTSTVDYFLIPQIDLELNVGTNAYDNYYYSYGGRFHLNSNLSRSAFTPFIGLLTGSDSGISFVQIPIGLSYISNFGLQVSVSFNQLQYTYTNLLTTYGEFRIGWRFKK